MFNVYDYDVYLKLNSDVTKLQECRVYNSSGYHGNKLICVFSENMKDCFSSKLNEV